MEGDWGDKDMHISRNDLIPSTIMLGMYALANTIVPVLVYYLWLMPNNYDMNEWTKNSWWTIWIGHLATWGAAALFWPLSYIGGPMASVYGWVWKWADGVSGPLMLTIFTMLIVAGIYMPSDKTVWETLVVYTVTQGVLGMMAMGVAKPAMMYYWWGEWDKWDQEAKEWCAKDANGECIECEDEDEDCKEGLQVATMAWSWVGF